MLPLFVESEDLAPPDPPDGVVIDEEAHGTGGPLGVSVRAPRTVAAQQFVLAAEAAGIPSGDYNGRDRGGPAGVSSLFQTTTRDGKRSSTYHAYLEPALDRANLTIITHALVERILLTDSASGLRATGITYSTADGESVTLHADEVVVSAGAIGSPQLLLLSGIGPRDELAAVGVECLLDNPHVGKHLKDHLHVPLAFPAPGVALTMTEIAISLGPDALRAPAGPLPADPADDADLPPELAGLKAEAERRVTEWAVTGKGLATRPSTTPSRSSPPGSATCTPTTRRSASSRVATPPASGRRSSASTRAPTSPTRPRPCPPTRRRSSSCPTPCSRTPRARSASPAPTPGKPRGSTSTTSTTPTT